MFSGTLVWKDFCFHTSHAKFHDSFPVSRKFGGSKELAVDLVAHTLERYPTRAISVAKRSPKPPLAIGSVACSYEGWDSWMMSIFTRVSLTTKSKLFLQILNALYQGFQMRYHLFQKFFGKMVKIKETSLLSQPCWFSIDNHCI